MKKLLALALLGCSTAAADPINYQIDLTVQGGQQALCGDYPYDTFGCSNSVGDTHLGSFTFDDGLISNFLLQIGTVVWDQEHPSDFLGFVNSNGLPTFFTVVGSELFGGVYGSADFPFVDFHGSTFVAMDVPQTQLFGSLAARQVPEPSPLLLFTLGFIALGLYTWRARN